MSSSFLSTERQRMFQEFIWRMMGDLHDSRWREMLDPATPLGARVRAYYARLAEDDDLPGWDLF